MNAYATQEYSEFGGKNIKEITQELQSKTDLLGKDLEFILKLRQFGLKEKLHFYLTGSKSGRGGMGTLIKRMKNDFSGDIDLMLVSRKNHRLVEEKFNIFITSFFGPLRKESRTLPIHFINETRNKTFYYDHSGRQIVELCIGRSLRGAMSRMYYYKKNWWHKIS
jgi:hypothetical protein